MPRVIWKGSISFGLVHVPVALYSGEQRDELHLSLLDSRDLAPVGYTRINKNTGEEVPWDQIVKGYEYAQGEYVVLGDEDFRRANVEATQTVEIMDFVDADEIPVMHYDSPYYLEPINKGEKGYALLRETLRRTGKVGIAKVVLRTRQRLAALMPHEQMLVLEVLRYQHELRSMEGLKLPGEDMAALGISKKEIDMAQRLVEDMVEPWRPEKYRDEYRDDLLHLVEEKVRAGQIQALEPMAETAPARTAEVVDLMSLLKRSIEEKEKARGKAKGGANKAPTRKKKTAKKRAG